MKWGILGMPSKTSLLNKELILQISRGTGWISIIYFLGLLFALPLRTLMLYTENTSMGRTPIRVDSLFDFQYDLEIQIGLLIAIPILMAVFLFRFLQVKQAADLMHSLPIRREKVFHHYTLSGVIALILPVLLIALILMVMHAALDLSSYFQLKSIFEWAGTTIIINLLLFMAGVFVAMITGISVVQGVLTYIFLLFPVGMFLLLFSNLNQLLFGFPGDYYLNRNLEELSPLTYVSVIDEKMLQGKEILLYAALTIILYGVSLYLYKKRKTESASEAIAFSKLRTIFKYGVTFCTMLFGGVYFSAVQSNSFIWMIFGYIIGAVIGYYIAEMVLQKTWRVFAKVKGLLIYGAMMAILVLGTQTLGFYENKVPDQDEVKNVLLTDSPHVYMEERSFDHVFTPSPLKEQENIEQVRKLHQQIVADKEERLQENYETAFFLYELKNGKKVIRQYRITKSQYEEFYEPIYESEEFKHASNEIFEVDVDEIKYMNMMAEGSIQKSMMFKSREELNEIIEVLKVDILEESYTDYVYYQGRGSMIELVTEGDRYIYLNLKPTYKGMHKWLEERDLLERVKLMPEDISSIQVVEADPDSEIGDIEGFLAQLETRSDVLRIADSKQIEEILNNAASWGSKHQFVVVLHYKWGNHPEVLYLDEQHIPDFLLSQLR
jgi:ABC-2 type transport system permease protein